MHFLCHSVPKWTILKKAYSRFKCVLKQLLFIGLTPSQSIYALSSWSSKVIIIIIIACPQKVQWHKLFEKYRLCGNQSGWSAFGLTIKIPSLWSPRTSPNNCFHRDIGFVGMLTSSLPCWLMWICLALTWPCIKERVESLEWHVDLYSAMWLIKILSPWPGHRNIVDLYSAG